MIEMIYSEFTKRPLAITACRLKKSMVIKTLEGNMTGNPGDWLVVGIDGEHYPVKDEIFRRTYYPTGVDRCQFCKKSGVRDCKPGGICLFEWRD